MNNRLVRLMGVAFCALAVVTSPRAASAQTAPNTTPLAGTWNMGLIGDHVIPVALVLEQDGRALKGTFIFMGKDFAVTGEAKGSTFVLTGKGPAFGRGNDHAAGTAAAAQGTERVTPTAALADMTITGSTDDTGGLAGQLATSLGDGRTGTIKWTAERLKERKATNTPLVSSAGVDMTGRWTMSIVEAQVQMTLDLKQTGAKITGTATSDHLGTMTVEGALANGTLTFSTAGSSQGQDVRLECSGKLKADGSLSGELTSPMGSMTWTLARVQK